MRQDRYLTLRPLEPLLPMAMGSMTWWEMCLNGVGIGMELTHLAARPTRVDLHRAPSGCIAAAAGAATPTAAEWQPYVLPLPMLRILP